MIDLILDYAERIDFNTNWYSSCPFFPSMLALHLLLAAFTTAQTGSSTSVAGSADCETYLESQYNKVEAVCGSKFAEVFVSSNATISTKDAIASLITPLKSVCAPKCITAIKEASAEIVSGACAKYTVSPGMDATAIVYYVQIYTAAGCIRTADNNDYCLAVQQAPITAAVGEVKDVNSIVFALLSSSDFTCTDCFQKQITAVGAIQGLPTDLQTTIQSFSNNLNSVCSRGIATVTANSVSTTIAATGSYPSPTTKPNGTPANSNAIETSLSFLSAIFGFAVVLL